MTLSLRIVVCFDYYSIIYMHQGLKAFLNYHQIKLSNLILGLNILDTGIIRQVSIYLETIINTDILYSMDGLPP